MPSNVGGSASELVGRRDRRGAVILITFAALLLMANIPAVKASIALCGSLENIVLLQNPSPTQYERLGWSLAALEQDVLVGAPDNSTGANQTGAVHLFNGTTGDLLRTFTNPTPEDQDEFGVAVAAVGSNVLVGANGVGMGGASSAGEAHLFDGSAGNLLFTIPNPNPGDNDNFGVAVAPFGNDILIGAPGVQVSGLGFVGEAYLFNGTTGDLVHTYTNPHPSQDDKFGWSIAAVGDRIAIAAPSQGTPFHHAGKVYVVDAETGGLLRTIENPSPDLGWVFGWSMAALGDNLVVSAPGPEPDGGQGQEGIVYLFDGKTGELLQAFQKSVPDTEDWFGKQVTVVGTDILVGAPYDDTWVADAGAAYLFNGTTGELITTFVNPRPGDNHQFGYSVAGNGLQAFVGARFDSAEAEQAGAAYAFWDTVPPVTAASPSGAPGLNGWWLSNVSVALTASDTISPVACTYYRVDGGAWEVYESPFFVEGDGIHTLGLRSLDHGGNLEQNQTQDVRIDSVAPQSSVNLSGIVGENDWYVSPVAVNLSATDATSGVNTIVYRLDGGPWEAYVAPFEVGDGQHEVEHRATDVAGNVEAVQVLDVKVDTRPPIIEFRFPPDSQWRKDTSITINWTIDDEVSGVDRVEIQTDGGSFRDTDESSLSLSGLADGLHYVIVRALDSAGNLGEARFEFGVDTVPPELTIDEPSSGAILTTSEVTVSWVPQDNLSASIVCHVALDDQEAILADDQNRHTFRSLADGQHNITVRCSDLAGNSRVERVSILVDTNPLSPTGPFGPWLLLTMIATASVGLVGAALYWMRMRRGTR